jgi:hypothetical protein
MSKTSEIGADGQEHEPAYEQIQHGNVKLYRER